MKTAKTKDLERSLIKKGFLKEDGDHHYYHLYVDDKKTTVFTKLSHSKSEVDEFILKMMAKQVKLNKKQFEDLINCPLSYEDYIKILTENKIINI